MECAPERGNRLPYGQECNELDDVRDTFKKLLRPSAKLAMKVNERVKLGRVSVPSARRLRGCSVIPLAVAQ